MSRTVRGPLTMKVFFTLPFFLIYLLVLQAFCWRQGWRRMARTMLTLTIVFIYLMSTPLMTRWLLKAVGEHPPVGHPERWTQGGVQAVVVLGGGDYRSPETGPETLAGGLSLPRVRYAATVARLTGLPLVMSGVEGPAMARTLFQDYGVQTQRVESASTNTAENAAFTARMLLPQGIRRIALVTDAWHMERARFAFAREGFEVYCAPTNFPDAVNIHSMALWMPRGQAFVENQFGLSELVGQVKYHVMPRAGSSAPAPAPLSDPAPGTKTRP